MGVAYYFTSVVRMLITKLAIVWEKLAGETLANLWSFAKFANVSPHQSFPPYGSGFTSLGANFPELSDLSISRNILDLEIHYPNNQKIYMGDISHKV